MRIYVWLTIRLALHLIAHSFVRTLSLMTVVKTWNFFHSQEETLLVSHIKRKLPLAPCKPYFPCISLTHSLHWIITVERISIKRNNRVEKKLLQLNGQFNIWFDRYIIIRAFIGGRNDDVLLWAWNLFTRQGTSSLIECDNLTQILFRSYTARNNSVDMKRVAHFFSTLIYSVWLCHYHPFCCPYIYVLCTSKSSSPAQLFNHITTPASIDKMPLNLLLQKTHSSSLFMISVDFKILHSVSLSAQIFEWLTESMKKVLKFSLSQLLTTILLLIRWIESKHEELATTTVYVPPR